MVRRTFYVRAVWDDGAKVFYSESDIEGLRIETSDIDEFAEIILDSAVELIVANHISLPDSFDSRLAR